MKKILVSIIAATGICCAAEIEKLPNGGEIQRFKVASKTMEGREINAGVVLPPQYFAEGKADEKFPVVYFMHGYGAPWETYSKMPYMREKLGDTPMIVVFFDGTGSAFYLDTKDPKMRHTTFFFDELMPYIEKNYRTSDSRHLAGFSMGGFGAMHYALTRPELFKTVSPTSSGLNYVDIVDGKNPGSRLIELLKENVGEFDPKSEAFAKNSIYGRLDKALKNGTKLPALLVLYGSEDKVADTVDFARYFVKHWKEKGLEMKVLELPGAHDWPFWKDTVHHVMEFAWEKR